MTDTDGDLTQQLAKLFHDVYEDAAALHGWSTQEQSRVQFADLPRANREAMLDAVCAVLVSGLVVPRAMLEVAEAERRDYLDRLNNLASAVNDLADHWDLMASAGDSKASWFARKLRALTRQETK